MEELVVFLQEHLPLTPAALFTLSLFATVASRVPDNTANKASRQPREKSQQVKEPL